MMELFSDQQGDEGLPGRQRGFAMVAVMTATTMAVFDGAIVNIALPQIARELDVSASAAIWVANAYLLTVAMSLAIFAALSRRTGFRALFAAGLALFTLASLGCALSGSLPWLIGMRVLQGIGGAATLSIAPAIHRSVFPNRLLGRILGLHALLIATCTAIAPILGGTLLSALGWQWIFAINVPLGVLGVVLALRNIPGARHRVTAAFDSAGAVLSAVAMTALILAADACARLAGAIDALHALHAMLPPLAFAVLAIAAGWAFVWRQRHAAEPLLPLAMFAAPRFSLAALTSLASFVGQGIAFVALPMLFQNVYGYNAFVAALLFTPWPVGIILAAPQAGKLADRYSPALLATGGLAVFLAGLVLLALLPYHPGGLAGTSPAAWDICWRELICGIGFGMFQSPNNREMMANASREHSGSASGVLAIVRTFGQCLGAAAVGVILSVYVHAGAATAAAAQAIAVTLWLAAAATALGLLISAHRLWRMQQAQSGQSTQVDSAGA